MLLWEMGSGQDPELQRHAAATLPEVLGQLEATQHLIAEHTATAPQGLAGTAPPPATSSQGR